MEIIVKTIFGSHLYGTNTPESDIDYKIVYRDSLKDIVLGKNKEEKRTVNEDHSEEAEYIELRKFLRDLAEGQTYAVDMFFTPDKMIIRKSEVWEQIKQQRRNLLSKDCKSFIGYCMAQAKLYSDKGRRIRGLLAVQEEIKDIPKIERVGLELKTMQLVEKDIKRNGEDIKELLYELNGKFYTPNMTGKQLRERIEAGLKRYGRRSKEASVSLRDWKAISHAYRTVRELKELALNGYIRFPLESADELLEIKRGTWGGFKDQRLEWELAGAIADVRASANLQDKVDQDWLEDFIYSFYVK